MKWDRYKSNALSGLDERTDLESSDQESLFERDRESEAAANKDEESKDETD